MKNTNHISCFSRLLPQLGLLKGNPLHVADIGARGGPQSHWNVYGQDVNVIGFEPYEEECDRLNQDSTEGRLSVPFRCFPVALGKTNGKAHLYDYPNKAANSFTPPIDGLSLSFREVPLSRFDNFAQEHGIAYIDFVKMDVERQEMNVIEGLGRFLEPGGILGLEVEVLFRPKDDAPLWSDIDQRLRSHGFYPYDIDIHRFASMRLPSPVAWDHRDHDGKPILGPTILGRMEHGDAVYFKDIRAEKESIIGSGNVIRILKMASLFELYGLSDCAVDLLEEYRPLIEQVVSVDTLVNAFVPAYYGPGLSYHQYLDAYHKHTGRVAPQPAHQQVRKSNVWNIFRRNA